MTDFNAVPTPPVNARPDDRKDFSPTHVQVCDMVARCLPEKSLGERFCSVFFQNSLKGKKKKKANPNMDHPQGCSLLCRTPINRIRNALHRVFSPEQVHILMVSSPEAMKPGGMEQTPLEKDNWLQFFLMDCILERQLGPTHDAAVTNTPIKVQAYLAFDMQPEADSRFCAAIAVIPDASLFYCVREQYPAVGTGDNHNKHAARLVAPEDMLPKRPLLPLDISESSLALAW
jgi:hypothetical protein